MQMSASSRKLPIITSSRTSAFSLKQTFTNDRYPAKADIRLKTLNWYFMPQAGIQHYPLKLLEIGGSIPFAQRF